MIARKPNSASPLCFVTLVVVCLVFADSGSDVDAEEEKTNPEITGAWISLDPVDWTDQEFRPRALALALASDAIYRQLISDKLNAIRMQNEAEKSFEQGVPDLSTKIQETIDAQLDARKTRIMDRLQAVGADVKALKLITKGHWSVTHWGAETGRVINHYGGTYTLDGNEYVETITYGIESRASLIGRRFRFAASVDGDTLILEAVGNTTRERWAKAKERDN